MATYVERYTNIQALSDLIAFAEANGYGNAEALGKMRHHLAQLSKPKAKSDLPSKTQRLNAELVEKVFEFVSDNPGVTATQVADGVGDPNITTPQKATILLSMLAGDGRVTREVVKGRAVWGVATA